MTGYNKKKNPMWDYSLNPPPCGKILVGHTPRICVMSCT